MEGCEAEKKYFSQWNPCEALTALQEYVEDVTNPKSKIFIRVEDRSTNTSEELRLSVDSSKLVW